MTKERAPKPVLEHRRMIRLARWMDDLLISLAADEGVSVSDLIRRSVRHTFILGKSGSMTASTGQKTATQSREEDC